MAKNKGGRPPKWNDDYVKKVKKKMLEYIEETEIPQLSDFAYKHKYPRSKLYSFKALEDTIDLLNAKKESVIELGALKGKYNPTMSIFSLKNLGWSDRQTIDNRHTVKHRVVKFENE